MTNEAKSFVPRTTTSWVGVALGLSISVVLALTFVLSNSVTNDGSDSAPLWLRVVVPAGVLAVALPAAIVGLRSRRTDPSVLGTIALVIACVIGCWVVFTGVASLFFE